MNHEKKGSHVHFLCQDLSMGTMIFYLGTSNFKFDIISKKKINLGLSFWTRMLLLPGELRCLLTTLVFSSLPNYPFSANSSIPSPAPHLSSHLHPPLPLIMSAPHNRLNVARQYTCTWYNIYRKNLYAGLYAHIYLRGWMSGMSKGKCYRTLCHLASCRMTNATFLYKTWDIVIACGSLHSVA